MLESQLLLKNVYMRYERVCVCVCVRAHARVYLYMYICMYVHVMHMSYACVRISIYV